VILLAQAGILAHRSIKNTFRQPSALIPSLIFPLLFMSVTTAGAGRIASVPGFQENVAKSYIDFYVAGALVQGTLFGGIAAGAQLATDMELGFIRRLLLTPLQRPALLIAAGTGAMVVGALQSTVLLVGGIVGGVRIKTGLIGAVAVIALSMLVALTFSSLGSLIASLTGSSEATQTFFPFFFVFMIFSSYFMPLEFLSGWFKAVATVNPATYIIEAVRTPITKGWEFRPILYGLIAIAGVCALGFGGAATALRTRLGRT
jgi:ABC-2 type transport system permease protein